MVSLCDIEPAQQIGISLVSLVRLAGIGSLVDRHEPHKPHETADTLLIDLMAQCFQVPCHLTYAVKRRLHELLIDVRHQL